MHFLFPPKQYILTHPRSILDIDHPLFFDMK